MRMDLGLSQNLKQIQTLSPQMYMSMEILCLNSLDLEERIETELENNVALEMNDVSASQDGAGDASVDGTSRDGEGQDERAAEAKTEDPLSDDASFDRKVEQWDEIAREEYSSGVRASSYDGERDDKLEALNNTEGKPLSLHEYLEEQLHLLKAEELRDLELTDDELEALLELCTEIIYNLDERGYLLFPIEEIHQAMLNRKAGDGGEEAKDGGEGTVATELGLGRREAPASAAPEGLQFLSSRDRDDGASSPPVTELPAEKPQGAAPSSASDTRTDRGDYGGDYGGDHTGDHAGNQTKDVSIETLRTALRVVQSLDPPGIGGRDLKECLLLQLHRDRQTYPNEIRVIENHLEDLANNRLPKIAKALGISLEEAKSAFETIASLNPIPGKLFGGEAPHYIKPDVLVEEVDGSLEVRIENDYLPRLRVSDYYRNLYKTSRKDPELKKFIKKKLESAEWLLSAIRQRQSTLERIAREVVSIQEGFFLHGISHLKPLKMLDVAERVGVHVSTISRAISGKYIQSPQGLHDLKFFFTGGAQKSDGTLEARGSVIQRIKDLVAEEDKKSPLSDIDIVRRLEESGITISRRTVTKYREAENIPSSRQRRAY